MFTKCQVDYYTETFSYMAFGVGVALGTNPEVQNFMLNSLSTVLSTADYVNEIGILAFADEVGILSVADQVTDMTLSTLDEVAMDKSTWSFLKSIEEATVKTFHQLTALIWSIFIHELIGNVDSVLNF